MTYKNDPLIEWLNKNTTPREIFLTDRFVNHPILMAGRRVFYGWPYYAWSAGYDASKRDRVYTELFENRDPWKVYRLLKENGINYVGFDGAVRQASFIKRPNEQLYATYFPKVFEDKQNRYNSLIIYKIPDTPPANLSSLPEGVSNMFDGGRGGDRGQFDAPTGIAVDASRNILVADTNNGRIEKFSPTGDFLSTMGIKGIGYGQLGAPNGIAIDRTWQHLRGRRFQARCGEAGVRRQLSSPSGRDQRLGSTARAGLLSARMIRSMSSIRVARESLSLAPMARC